MMASRSWSTLEHSFVVMAVILGAFLLFITSTQLQDYHYDFFRQYKQARKEFAGRRARELNEAKTKQPTLPDTRAIQEPSWMREVVIPPRRYVSLMTHPFLKDYVIENPDVCHNSSVDLLIIIHSAVTNFQRRRILRETWAATGTFHGVKVRRVFALGRGGRDKKTQIRVNSEYAAFNDIVQGDFRDSFSNLTRKAVMMLRWVNDHCLHARFILKTDDDVFVNIYSLLETHLQRLSGATRTAMCNVKAENTSMIVRDPSSKWYVPNWVLPQRTSWPVFCSGFVVVLTTDAIPDLYRASFVAPFVSVDDAYVYGILPSVAKHSPLKPTPMQPSLQQHSPKHHSFLHYVDMSHSVVVDDGKLLARGPRALQWYVAGTAVSDIALLKLWQMAVDQLSPWASQRATVAQIHFNVSAIT